MNNSITRVIFFTVASIVAGLLGWSISQLFLDLSSLLDQQIARRGDISLYTIFSHLIMVVIVPCLAIAMVVTEIFTSNPTRHKANWRILSRYLLRAVLTTGVISGILLSLLNLVLFESNWLARDVRILSWSLVGLFVGLAEGISWRFYSMEGTNRRLNQRIPQSALLGSLAGLVAAYIYDSLRQSLGQYQEPFGFVILSVCLGLALCFAARPSYQVALRAGQGFEAIKPKGREEKSNFIKNSIENLPDSPPYQGATISKQRPTLKNSGLSLIPNISKYIQEGLSIQLPSRTNRPLIVGSAEVADIYIPHIPEQCMAISIQNGEARIECFAERAIQVQQRWMTEGRSVILRHNQILTLYHEDGEQYYRFVFYDRFLDPKA